MVKIYARAMHSLISFAEVRKKVYAVGCGKHVWENAQYVERHASVIFYIVHYLIRNEWPVMMLDDDAKVFERRFKRVFHEIEYIRNKINRKDGFLFFKTHTYTVDSLMNSEHHQKIDAITEKVGDDANNWFKSGKLSDIGRDHYYRKRDEVEDELHSLNLEIQSRKPTWWEQVKGAFTGFVEAIAKNMPELVRNMLDNVANKLKLPSPIRKILRLPHAGNKSIDIDY